MKRMMWLMMKVYLLVWAVGGADVPVDDEDDAREPSGYNESGYNESGYNESGYGESGYNESGYGESGYNESGYGESGYGESGYNESGYGESGHMEPPYYDLIIPDGLPLWLSPSGGLRPTDATSTANLHPLRLHHSLWAVFLLLVF